MLGVKGRLSEQDSGRDRDGKLKRELQSGTSLVELLKYVELLPIKVDAKQFC